MVKNTREPQTGPQRPDLAQLLTPSRIPPCNTPGDWNSILRPYLADALTSHGSYTTQNITHHLDFFTTHVAPWLGPGPSSHPDTGAIHPSSLTNDHTPFELSCCWKSKTQHGKPIVRYVTDVVPTSLETTRMAAFHQARHVIDTLTSLAKDDTKQGATLRAFPQLWSRITDNMIANEEATHSAPCARCSPSGIFIGFDLVDSTAFAKPYWIYPACQTTPTLVSSIRDTLAVCAESNPTHFPRLLESWAKVARHINANANIVQPRMLSVDATKFPLPRVKVYTRCLFQHTNTFSDIEPHLNLGGTIPLTQGFRDTCEKLWSALVGPEDSTPGIGPKYCLLLYELPTGAPGEAEGKEVSAKLYIMCQEIPRTDRYLAEKLYENCPVLQDAELIKEFTNSAEPTAFICEVGLAPRGTETEVSIYCSPCWSSRKTWKACLEDTGRLRKVRRNLSPN